MLIVCNYSQIVGFRSPGGLSISVDAPLNGTGLVRALPRWLRGVLSPCMLYSHRHQQSPSEAFVAEVAGWHTPPLDTAFAAHCALLGAPPSSAVSAALQGCTLLAHSERGVRGGAGSVVLRGCCMAGPNAVAAVLALMHQAGITTLDLSTNVLDAAAATALCRVLDAETLQGQAQMSLAAPRHDLAPPLMRLQVLTLRSCGMQGGDLHRILSALARSPSRAVLLEVDVSHNAVRIMLWRLWL